MVGKELDEATHMHMKHHEQKLRHRMSQLLAELEQGNLELRTQEQSIFAWEAILFSDFQRWQFWALEGLLVLLCWWLSKRSHQPDGRDGDNSSSSNSEQEEDEAQEEVEEESDQEDADGERDLGRIFGQDVQWPAQHPAYGRKLVEKLVGNLLRACQELLFNSFFPVLQPAIKVGSAFEGWAPREDDAVYCLLLPLKPPRGHTFHLELDTPEEIPVTNSRVRVELKCTCMEVQLVGKMLCFVHRPEQELRRNQGPSLLHTLCTDSYLDVEKTAHWFQSFVSSAWARVPQSRSYDMKVLPSSRSCKLQLTDTSGRTALVEIIFGVQQGDSDIFLSSEGRDDIFLTRSTIWPESYAVAEAKFFSHVARQAPRNSFHLKCLQLWASILEGTGFTTYTLKTVVMHLLATTPLSGWRRRDFLLRLEDIMRLLHCCLEDKCLVHFFFGNENVPEEIILPPAFKTAKPYNLFYHLLHSPADHAQALRDYMELEDRLTTRLYYGH
ncbi:inositol 1,4,5-trisphosphate receptor-interacting protein-like 1 [Pterocles gutturalis]